MSSLQTAMNLRDAARRRMDLYRRLSPTKENKLKLKQAYDDFSRADKKVRSILNSKRFK